ncbi:Chitin synthase, class 7 [Lobosporangium transversale]|nr:Chitin synthase, class 7 [Lobosporangium transversale]
MSSTPNFNFAFGSFNYVCSRVSLTLCPLVGTADGIEPLCYSRNVKLADTLIFQPSTLIIHIIALVMTAIMIYHIRSKYTAYFAGAHLGLISATFWCLLLNGFVGFQFAEDGTPLSLWSIRISSFVVFAAVTFLSIATFLGLGPFKPTNPVALWVVFFIFNGAALLIYVILQIVLVVNTLDDRWPLGDIVFGIAFFATGQVILYVFSLEICNFAKHYIDGLFFGTIATLLSVMMVYKYWDSITKEDLEFSVGSKQNVWEVKELLGEDEMAGGGLYSQPQRFNNSPATGPYGQANFYEERY